MPFFRQNLILRCQLPPLVSHLVHDIRVLLLSSLDMGSKYRMASIILCNAHCTTMFFAGSLILQLFPLKFMYLASDL